MKVFFNIVLGCFGLCLIMFPAFSALGQGKLTVESVSLHREKNRQEKVRIKLSGPFTPKVSTIGGDKPRLLIDIAGAGYAGLVTPLDKGGETLVKNIRVGVHTAPNPMVRIVLDLEPGRKYSYTKDLLKQENVLNVNLVPAESTKTSAAAVVRIEAESTKTARIEAGPTKQKMMAGVKEVPPEQAKKQPPTLAKQPVETAAPEQPAADDSTETIEPQVKVAAEAAVKSAETPSVGDEAKEEKPTTVPPPVTVDKAISEEEQSQTPEPAAEAKDEEKPATEPAVQEEEEKPVAEVSSKTASEGGVAKTTSEAPAVKESAEKQSPAAPARVEPEEKKVEAAKQESSVAKESEKESAKTVEAAQPPTETEAPAATDPQLLELTYENNSSKGEMIFFHLSGFYPPTVSALEGDVPQVVCDFEDMTKGEKVKPVIEARGAYVQKIELKAGDKPQQIRVLLTLAPNRDYDLRQVFFKEDNLFVLVVDTMGEESGGKDSEKKK